MFIGHNGLGFALKRAAPEVSLTALFTAVQAPDLLWPVLLFAGAEKVEPTKGPNSFLNLDFLAYPYSHSLVGTALLGLVFGLVWKLIGRERTWRGAAILAFAVVSHWILDWITHVPDLPLSFSDGQKYGMGMWNSPLLTIAVELLIFGSGALVYSKFARPTSQKGTMALASFLVVMLALYVGNAMSPPPPSAEAVAVVGFAGWLVVAWAYWMDRTRSVAM